MPFQQIRSINIHMLEHILDNEHISTLGHTGTQTPPKDIYSPNCWQNMSNTNESLTGQMFFNSWQYIQYKYIHDTGAQFAGAHFATPAFSRGQMPGPNSSKSGKLGPKKCGAEFATKSARGPICRRLICWGQICLEPYLAHSPADFFRANWKHNVGSGSCCSGLADLISGE